MGKEGKEVVVIEGEKKSEKELSSDKNAKDTEVRRLEGERGRRGRDRINKLFCYVYHILLMRGRD